MSRTGRCAGHPSSGTPLGTANARKKEGFAARREALERESAFLNNCCKSDVTITFDSLVVKYMEDCAARLAPRTLSNKRHVIQTKLFPYFGEIPLNTITVAVVRTWQNKLITDEAHYSPTYLKCLHNQLSAIMNFAVKFYGLPKDSAAMCGSMSKENADTMQFWTMEEFNRLAPYPEADITIKTIFYLLFYSGMRVGEMLALTLNDFDFEANTVSITKNFARVGGKDLIKEPKTPKSRRTITLPVQIMETVKAYTEKIYDCRPDDRLF